MADRSPSQSKAVSNRNHARWRAFDRYGLDLSDEAFADIEARILASGEGVVPLRRDTNYRNRMIYAVQIEDLWVPVVFDESTSSLISFLPRIVIDAYRNAVQAPKPAETPTPKPLNPEPFVGCVVGFIPIPAFDPDGELARLPEVPDIPDGVTWEALFDIAAALKKRRQAIELMCTAWYVRKKDKPPLSAELARLATINQKIRKLRKAMGNQPKRVKK